MNKRKETVAKILTLLDGLSDTVDTEARVDVAEEFLNVLVEEISARQAECFSQQSKLCGILKTAKAVPLPDS